jgi:hypothetical protein
MAALAYVAMTQDVLEEGRDKRRVYVLTDSNPPIMTSLNS